MNTKMDVREKEKRKKRRKIYYRERERKREKEKEREREREGEREKERGREREMDGEDLNIRFVGLGRDEREESLDGGGGEYAKVDEEDCRPDRGHVDVQLLDHQLHNRTPLLV
jgi:hypothetical protein